MNEIEDINRQLIPRFNRFKVLRQLNEIRPGPPAKIPDEINSKLILDERENDWRARKDLFSAADLLGSALFFDGRFYSSLTAPLDFIKGSNFNGPFLKQLVGHFSLPKDSAEIVLQPELNWYKSKIREIKNYLAVYDRNPILWVDLAFLYTVLDMNDKASRCIQVATTLGKENRFVLRSAARFYVHTREPDLALGLLRASRTGKLDPWLVSTEISLCEHFKLPSKRLDQGKKLLGMDLLPFDLCELHGTFGTLEYHHGNFKLARRHFQSALTLPNENTIAQAEWISPKIGLQLRRVPESQLGFFEADTRRQFREGRFEEAIASATKWKMFQPFSARPYLMASSIAMSALNNPAMAMQILKSAPSSAYKSHFMMHNNLVCAYGSAGYIQEAESELRNLRGMEGSKNHPGYLLANQGLIEFRKNEPVKGLESYKEALKIFRTKKDAAAFVSALTFLSRECINFHEEIGLRLLGNAEKAAKELGLTEMIAFAGQIRQQHFTKEGNNPVRANLAEYMGDFDSQF